jgi:hypothetical protein
VSAFSCARFNATEVIENMPGQPVVKHVVSIITTFEIRPEWAAYPTPTFWGCPDCQHVCQAHAVDGRNTDGTDRRAGRGDARIPSFPQQKAWWDRNLIQALAYRSESATGLRYIFNEVIYFHVSQTLMVTDLFSITGFDRSQFEFGRRVGTRARRCGNSMARGFGKGYGYRAFSVPSW